MKPARGIIAAAITPRGKAGDADFGAALELIDYLCAAGVNGIALLGATGEFAALNLDERGRLAYLATKRSRVPVLVGVAHATLDGAVALGREACAAGAGGLLLMPPYFFRYEQDEVREFYTRFAVQVGRGVPVYLYNIPAFTTPLEVETAAELLETGQFAGIKDSSAQMSYFERLKAARANSPFTLLIGHDRIFTRARQAGADGLVSGIACAVPELLVGLDSAIGTADSARVERLDARLSEFLEWTERFPAPVAIRAATECRGLRAGPHAVPLAPPKSRLLGEFCEWFGGWSKQVKREASGA
jgi:4-hydroxy-tetrahydrodipicolinate synthase